MGGCPICRVIEHGGNPRKGTLCPDCAENRRLQDEFDAYQILQHVLSTGVWFTWSFPLLVGVGAVVQITRTDASVFSVVCGQIGAWWLYFFNVFWLFPRQGMPRALWCRKEWPKLTEQRDKMFVLKLKGVPEDDMMLQSV